MHDDTYVIIPVYNEAARIGEVVQELKRSFRHIVCVDDGSADGSAAEIIKAGAILVQHPINLGQGAALQTGIDHALQDSRAQYFVTFDADGQHRVEDALAMLRHLREHDVDIVLGSRFLGAAKNISPLKKLVLKAAIVFSNRTSGLKLSDAHNGLRVFNRTVAEQLCITMPDMAHASEIIHRIAEHRFRYAELPVTIVYTDYSRAKGQSVLNAVNISFDLLLQRIAKK